MDKKIKIINGKGKEFEAELVMCFDVEELNKSYIIYKFAEEDEKQLVTLHTSILSKKEDGKYMLEDIKDNNEWLIIKSIMKKVVDESEEV